MSATRRQLIRFQGCLLIEINRKRLPYKVAIQALEKPSRAQFQYLLTLGSQQEWLN